MTSENWKTSTLNMVNIVHQKYGAADLLVINEDTSGIYVESMNCSLCKKYKNFIFIIKNLNLAWTNEGLKCNAALTDAKREPDKVVCVKLLKDDGKIVQGIDTFNEHDLERTKKKFETAFFVAKEELPMVRFERILL